MTTPYKATENHVGKRIDSFLAEMHADLSRSRIKQLIEQGEVTNSLGKPITSPSQKVKLSEAYNINIPPPVEMTITPVDIPLDIAFEDEHMLVINKQAGLTVHPAAGNWDYTLVHGLLAHCGDSLSGVGGVARPGIVHRLDKDTSGLMVVAKHDKAHQMLAAQLADRSLKRIYHALVWGITSAGMIEGAIGRSPKDRKKMAVVERGGKKARTHYKTISKQMLGVDKKRGENIAISLVECRLDTGRTHQIRVHMAHAGYPLIGDPNYGNHRMLARLPRLQSNILTNDMQEMLAIFNRQALHAKEIGFIHPESKEIMHFTSDYPEDFTKLVDALKLRDL